MVGGGMLFSLAEGGKFVTYDIKSGEVLRSLQLDNEPSAFMHPMTYINKLLFLSKTQGMELWNVVEGKIIYSFTKAIFGEKQRTVTCVEQSPVVNVVAVGFSDGLIGIVDLQFDEVVSTF